MKLIFDGKSLIPDDSITSGNYLWKNNINGKVYIGASSKIFSRVSDEIKAFTSGKSFGLTKLSRAVWKYGLQNFNIYAISSLPMQGALVEECRLIKDYDSLKNGYNCTKGGDGVIDLDPKIKKKTIEKIKKYWTPEQKKKHSEKMKEWFAERTKDEQDYMIESGGLWIKNPTLVKKQKDGCKQSIKDTNRVEKQRKSLKNYYRAHESAVSRPITVMSPHGKTEEYPSIRKFYLKNNLSETMIRRMVKNKISSYKGWKIIKI